MRGPYMKSESSVTVPQLPGLPSTHFLGPGGHGSLSSRVLTEVSQVVTQPALRQQSVLVIPLPVSSTEQVQTVVIIGPICFLLTSQRV